MVELGRAGPHYAVLLLPVGRGDAGVLGRVEDGLADGLLRVVQPKPVGAVAVAEDAPALAVFDVDVHGDGVYDGADQALPSLGLVARADELGLGGLFCRHVADDGDHALNVPVVAAEGHLCGSEDPPPLALADGVLNAEDGGARGHDLLVRRGKGLGEGGRERIRGGHADGRLGIRQARGPAHGLVDEERPAVAVHHEQHVRDGVHDGAEEVPLALGDLVRGAEVALGPFRLGDVAGGADEADDLASGVAKGHLRGAQPPLLATQQGGLLRVHERLARGHHLHVVGVVLRRAVGVVREHLVLGQAHEIAGVVEA